MIKSFKNKVLAILLSFMGVVIVSFIFNYYIQETKEEVLQISLDINNMNTAFLKDIKITSDFYTFDCKNPEFFVNNKSIYYDRHKLSAFQINSGLEKLKKSNKIKYFGIKHQINEIIKAYKQYDMLFIENITLIRERGYKDWGIEGKMRDYIHKLEEIEEVDLSDVLMLRRHEKDYIIRNELKYIKKLHDRAKLLRNKILTGKLSEFEKADALETLNLYVHYFDKMVDLDKRSGIKNNTGLKHKFDKQAALVSNQFSDLQKYTITRQENILKQIRIIHFVIISLIIIIGFITSYYTSRRLTKNISILAFDINQFVKGGFKEENPVIIKRKTDEMGKLIQNYNILKHQIFVLITQFKKKVEERTHEITHQKNKIEEQNSEILAQRDRLYAINEEIENQNTELNKRNRDITASIRYSQRIQNALLPQKNELDRIFEDNFILYTPRDLISGDFYWIKNIKNNIQNYTILVVADCTGHGVPGALLSMLGIAFLNEIVLYRNIVDPAEILNQLRKNIIYHLDNNNESFRSSDGMDLSIVRIDHNSQKHIYAGANQPLVVVREHEKIVHKADKMPIGRHVLSENSFTNKELQLNENDMVYMFTDGFADQIGGENMKKYMKKNLYKLFIEISDLQTIKQNTIISQAFENWRGDTTQTDDLTILGFRYQNEMTENIKKSNNSNFEEEIYSVK